jgi:2-succinyl-5-enolpyruvyl-6-hydroxy-3-cyclohexene-1-carboxylate synthase
MNNLLTQWSRVLLRSLADAGVKDVVLSPGSRSTPLMIAATEQRDLRCHDAIDERSAAFFALGQARRSGVPSVLICTSGSAGTHYLPAIVEANAAFVPLLVLTADRPVELQDCAAAQTIDQIKLFGGHARRFYDLGMPDGSTESLRALRRMAAQAAFTSMWPLPGLVHLNARARKPLEPRVAAAGREDERALEQRADTLLARPIVTARRPPLVADAETLRELADACRGASRGLIVCGPAPVTQAADRAAVLELAALLRFPVLCEATSQLRLAGAVESTAVVCEAFDTFLRAPRFRAAHAPDLVLQLAAPPTSGPYDAYVEAHPSTSRVVIAPHGWNDPQSSASRLVFADVGEVARGLLAALRGSAAPPSPVRAAWESAFARANATAWEVVEADLVGSSSALTEGAAVRAVVRSLPAGSLLAIGNSLAIRELDTFTRAGDANALVLSQRGTNGIDGLIAGSLGSASVDACPLTLLLGDVSFLHDVGSLSLASRTRVPVTIVVMQNRGGRIFEQLPLASLSGLDPSVLAHVTTPHTFELEHAARLYGLSHERVGTQGELESALARSRAKPGCTIIEAVVPDHGAFEQHKRIWQRAQTQVDAGLAPVSDGVIPA